MENIEESEKQVNWIRPNLEHEKGEIERVLKDFLHLEATEQNRDRIIEAINSAPIVELSQEDWEKLYNTDSFHNVRPGRIEDAEENILETNLNLAPENRRDFQALFDAFNSGKEIEVPIIIENDKGIKHLLSGNTRLMIARALKIQPKVIITNLYI